MAQHGIDGVAQVLARVDQGAIQVEEQQFDGFGGNAAIDLDHLHLAGWFDTPIVIINQ